MQHWLYPTHIRQLAKNYDFGAILDAILALFWEEFPFFSASGLYQKRLPKITPKSIENGFQKGEYSNQKTYENHPLAATEPHWEPTGPPGRQNLAENAPLEPRRLPF